MFHVPPALLAMLTVLRPSQGHLRAAEATVHLTPLHRPIYANPHLPRMPPCSGTHLRASQ